jgi:hypothetical protein
MLADCRIATAEPSYRMNAPGQSVLEEWNHISCFKAFKASGRHFIEQTRRHSDGAFHGSTGCVLVQRDSTLRLVVLHRHQDRPHSHFCYWIRGEVTYQGESYYEGWRQALCVCCCTDDPVRERPFSIHHEMALYRPDLRSQPISRAAAVESCDCCPSSGRVGRSCLRICISKDRRVARFVCRPEAVGSPAEGKKRCVSINSGVVVDEHIAISADVRWLEPGIRVLCLVQCEKSIDVTAED